MFQDEVKTYKLKKPIKLGDKEIHEVTLKEPSMEHLKGIVITRMSVDDYATLFGRISDQPSIVFEKMKITDGIEVTELIADFLEGGQKTGQS